MIQHGTALALPSIFADKKIACTNVWIMFSIGNAAFTIDQAACTIVWIIFLIGNAAFTIDQVTCTIVWIMFSVGNAAILIEDNKRIVDQPFRTAL